MASAIDWNRHRSPYEVLSDFTRKIKTIIQMVTNKPLMSNYKYVKREFFGTRHGIL